MPQITVDKVEMEDHRLKEADLSRHLENTNRPSNGTAKSAEVVNGEDGRPLAQSDFALFEALNMLKGMVILGTR